MNRKSMYRVLFMGVILVLFASFAAPGLAAGPAQLKRGNSGAEVLQMQGKLIEYGYPSPDNSKFDSATLTAVKYFQAANRFKVNGVATSAMRQFLNAGVNVVGFLQYAESEMLKDCKKGSTGLRVRQVQERLKELGYYKGRIDGRFTETLRKAVIKFEQFNSISPTDGKVSTKNRTQMNSDAALSYSQVNGPDTLKPGSKGQKVLKLQVVMREMRYYKSPLDGKYSSSLVKAVKGFQKSKKLYPSGIAYSTTMALLEDKMTADDTLDPRVYSIIETAKNQLAKKYKARAAGPNAFDCSGFTRYVFRKAAGMTLTESAATQSKRGQLVVNREDILPGDLVFFATSANKANLNHVGICIASSSGNIRFIHASSEKGKVIASEFKDAGNGNFYGDRFLFARRMW